MGWSAQFSLACFERVQMCLWGLDSGGGELFSSLQLFSKRQDVASLSLLYSYFHGKWFGELHSLVSSAPDLFSVATRCTTYTSVKPPRYVRSPIVSSTRIASSEELLLSRTGSQQDVFSITTILTISNLHSPRNFTSCLFLCSNNITQYHTTLRSSRGL